MYLSPRQACWQSSCEQWRPCRPPWRSWLSFSHLRRVDARGASQRHHRLHRRFGRLRGGGEPPSALARVLRWRGEAGTLRSVTTARFGRRRGPEVVCCRGLRRCRGQPSICIFLRAAPAAPCVGEILALRAYNQVRQSHTRWAVACVPYNISVACLHQPACEAQREISPISYRPILHGDTRADENVAPPVNAEVERPRSHGRCLDNTAWSIGCSSTSAGVRQPPQCN